MSSSLFSENKGMSILFSISLSTASILFLRELTFKCPSITYFGSCNLCSSTCGYELPSLLLLRGVVLFALKSHWFSGQEITGLSALAAEIFEFKLPFTFFLLTFFFNRKSVQVANTNCNYSVMTMQILNHFFHHI